MKQFIAFDCFYFCILSVRIRGKLKQFYVPRCNGTVANKHFATKVCFYSGTQLLDSDIGKQVMNGPSNFFSKSISTSATVCP